MFPVINVGMRLQTVSICETNYLVLGVATEFELTDIHIHYHMNIVPDNIYTRYSFY